ncbi:triose-phosphate isomerase [Flavobacteriaceae bacterium Ap0902]|nr:triose-phosphate isomerase [Flavobacteriaceae bacterium Ap0902]
MRTKIVAGNWKMNMKWVDAKSLLLGINQYVNTHKPNCEVIVCPPYPYLDNATEILSGKVQVGSQNISEYEKGAYTGEISAEILNSFDVSYAIVGHSERRSIFKESNEQIGEKVKTAIKNNINTIICCGETLEERQSDNHKKIVKEQLEAALADVSDKDIANQVIAYEPVWAIGTGETASPAQAQEMHQFIRREILESKYGNDLSDKVRILYGGSVKPGNAEELFSKPDIDGGLIGGASLKEDDFASIINAASRTQ